MIDFIGYNNGIPHLNIALGDLLDFVGYYAGPEKFIESTHTHTHTQDNNLIIISNTV